MAEAAAEADAVAEEEGGGGGGAAMMTMSRKEKRKAMKKTKRQQTRKEIALKEREEADDPEELVRVRAMEEEEAERSERERKLFEERERAWVEAMEIKTRQQRLLLEQQEEQGRIKLPEVENANESNDEAGDDWEYVEEGPAEIIWQGNEITVKKKRVKVPKRMNSDQPIRNKDPDRPTSNPLPPQSEAFSDYKNSSLSAQQLMDNVAQQVPNFGTEQDKAHCPFHLKTGACRFGHHCSRVHFYPNKSCTLLIKNMYNGPGLAWEQDEVLEVVGKCIFSGSHWSCLCGFSSYNPKLEIFGGNL